MSVVERLNTALGGRYRIERELGAGGMATVFLADDLRHHRRVAIKVMRPELAAVIGADRFLAEITTTANLQHPHILPLFDSGTVEGTVFYVMPFVDGESLRDRLDREKQLPIDEAVRIATEAAGALHYAHGHGVIHRDIKPENILLHGGHALVADFGIALAAARTGGSRMTETGMSLGTPAYMSPEQAMGERALDARTDIYALGCVLYEMLVGDPPHAGSTAQAIVAKVITEKPASIIAHRDRVPEHVEDSVMTALEKLPADRFASAAEFAAALGGRNTRPARTARPAAGAPGDSARPRRWAMAAGALVAAGVLFGVAAGWTGRGWSARPVIEAPIRFTASFGVLGGDWPYLSIAPDGRRIMRPVSDSAGVTRLMVLDLGTGAAASVPGTEHAYGGEFSPRGDWIAFTANGQLRKIAVQGGPAAVLSTMRVDNMGVAWIDDGQVIFSGRGTGLWRVAAEGGAPVQLTRLDTTRNEFGHWAPQVLPGGRAVIYSSYAERTRIEAYDFASGRTTVLLDGAVFGRYSPSGHLLFARDGAVFAIPFDPARLAVSGAAVPVQDDVVWEANNALAGFGVSANGTFVYLRASEWFGDRTLVWRDRAGRDTTVIDTRGAFAHPRLSPDGRWIALTVRRPKPDVWLFDVSRSVLTQLTRAPAAAFNAVWLPDSRSIVYTHESPVYNLHRIPIDASAPDGLLLASAFDKFASSISPDSLHLLLTEATTGDRVMIARLDGGGEPRLLTETSLEQRLGVFSPDGRWIAYSEHGDGVGDIYIRSVSGAGGRRLVSAGGGMQPRWTRGGREIVYMTGTTMMSVAVDPVTGTVGAPTALFSVTDLERERGGPIHSYDVTADGQRFLVVKSNVRPAAQPLGVVLNWRPDVPAATPGRRSPRASSTRNAAQR
jgi:eukaryotic-like serine/threonine-protein kinase